MTRGGFLLGCFTLVACAQAPKDTLEDKLPTLGACPSVIGLKPLRWQEIGVPGWKARDEFSKAVPESMPKAMEAALSNRRQDFANLHRSLTSGAGLPKDAEDALRKLAGETQTILESNFQPVGEKSSSFTPLIVLTTTAQGDIEWALIYFVFADQSAFRSSPGFSAEIAPGGRLFLRTIGRDIDRAHLSGAVAAGIVSSGGSLGGLRCGPLLERNLPSVRK